MLLFCPNCSNVLTVSTKPDPTAAADNSNNNQARPSISNRLECQTCPYEYALTKKIYERKTFVRREREDVFGGATEWENAQKTTMQCPQDACVGNEAAFYMVQIRSADEPMTGFFKCMTCRHNWREN